MSNARNLSNLLGTGTTIATASIADDAITSAKIADDAVVAAAIADDAIVAAAIADNAVVSAAIANDAITAAKIADGAVSKGFSNVTMYSASSASNTIPSNADKLLFVIAGGGGGGAASFAASGNAGGNSTVVYNSITYTATGGTGADPADGGFSGDTAPAHSGGTATGGLVITGGGSTGGASGQTIASNYSASPIQGLHGGMVIVQVDVVSGQTTYAVTVGAGGTAGSGTYNSDTATGAAGAAGYVLVYDNG